MKPTKGRRRKDEEFFIYRVSGKKNKHNVSHFAEMCKLTWLVLGGDPAARSHRVEQFTAL